MRSVEDALAWLDQQADSGNAAWYRLCLSMAAKAFGLGYSGVGSYGRANPTTFWNNARVIKRHEGDTNPPAGALVFWQGRPGSTGHIAVADGNGNVYSNDIRGRGQIDLVPLEEITNRWGLKYMGWGAPAFPSGGYDVATGFSTRSVNAEPSNLNGGSGEKWLAQFLYAKGLRGDDLKTAWAIAMRETRGTPNIDNRGLNQNGSVDYGLFQINSVHAANIKKKFGWSMEDLKDPNKAFAVYWWMSNQGKSLGAWGLGAQAYDPANAGKHQADFRRFAAQFGQVAQKAGLNDVSGRSQVDQAARRGKPVTSNPRPTNTGADGEKPDKLTPQQAADKYGLTYALFKSDPELEKLLKEAIAKGWDQKTFQARLENSQWWRNHGAAWREAEVLYYRDPKQYAANMIAQQATMAEMAANMGAILNGQELKQLSWRAVRYGWNPSQIRAELAKHIQEMNVGGYAGEAGMLEDDLRALALANGVTMDEDFYRKAVTSVMGGSRTAEEWEDYIRQQAASMFPVFSQQILEGGMNARELAGNYIQRYASLLEVDPSTVSLSDPLLRQALSGTGQDGTPQAMGLWDFEKSLRKDPRWMNTKNAKDEFDSTVVDVLQTFGFMG